MYLLPGNFNNWIGPTWVTWPIPEAITIVQWISILHVWQFLKTVWVVATRACSWHLVGGGQGCPETSYIAQVSPHNKNLASSKFHSANLAKPCYSQHNALLIRPGTHTYPQNGTSRSNNRKRLRRAFQRKMGIPLPEEGGCFPGRQNLEMSAKEVFLRAVHHWRLMLVSSTTLNVFWAYYLILTKLWSSYTHLIDEVFKAHPPNKSREVYESRSFWLHSLNSCIFSLS